MGCSLSGGKPAADHADELEEIVDAVPDDFLDDSEIDFFVALRFGSRPIFAGSRRARNPPIRPSQAG